MMRPVVLVLRSSDRFSDLLCENGCQVVNLELTKTEPLDDLTDLKNCIAEIGRFDGLFFTSPIAAKIFVLELSSLDLRFNGKIYVLGERARTVFENAGMSVEQRSDANTAEDLINGFGVAEFAGKSFLFVRGDRSLRTIPELLSSLASVDEAIVYRTIDDQPDANTMEELRKRLRNGRIDWVCFFAPSSVDGFRKFFCLEDLKDVKTAAIGKTTGRRVKETGLHLDFISERATADDFAAGLFEYIKRIE
jgi:uroporphyrinogen-III synthase